MLQIWQAGEWCEKVTVLNLLNLNNVNLRLFGWPGFESGHDFAVSCLATHAARYRLTGLPLDFRAAHFVVVFVWFFFLVWSWKRQSNRTFNFMETTNFMNLFYHSHFTILMKKQFFSLTFTVSHTTIKHPQNNFGEYPVMLRKVRLKTDSFISCVEE